MGVVNQTDTVGDPREHLRFRNVVVDDNSHTRQTRLTGFNREIPRLDPAAYVVEVGQELLNASGHLVTVATRRHEGALEAEGKPSASQLVSSPRFVRHPVQGSLTGYGLGQAFNTDEGTRHE